MSWGDGVPNPFDEAKNERIAQLEAQLEALQAKRDGAFNDEVEMRLRAEADVAKLREALSAAFQSMANAHHRLKSPDMGGTYLERARETLVAGKSAALAALAATEPKEGGR